MQMFHLKSLFSLWFDFWTCPVILNFCVNLEEEKLDLKYFLSILIDEISFFHCTSSVRFEEKNPLWVEAMCLFKLPFKVNVEEHNSHSNVLNGLMQFADSSVFYA